MPDVHCFSCGRELLKENDDEDNIQAYRAMIFRSHGDSCSQVFDSMTGDDSLLISICDECVKENISRVFICTPIRRRVEVTLEQVDDWKQLP